MKFNIETYEPKGELKGFPKEVIKRMLECQVEQGNEEDVSVFENNNLAYIDVSGFSWDETEEGGDFWSDVIGCQNFDVFFKKYPKAKELSIYQQMNDMDGSTVDDIWAEISYSASRLQENASSGCYSLANVYIASLTVAFERLYALEAEREEVVVEFMKEIIKSKQYEN